MKPELKEDGAIAMAKSDDDESVRERGAQRPVAVLLSVSVALQALAFAIPGDALSLLCRAVGVLLLIVALLVSLKGGANGKPFLAVGIGAVAGLAAIASMITLL